MSFFKPFPQPEQPPQEAEKPKENIIPPHMIIIEGSNLIKEVADNPDIKEGKLDVYLHGVNGPVSPYNYDPTTGNIK